MTWSCRNDNFQFFSPFVCLRCTVNYFSNKCNETYFTDYKHICIFIIYILVCPFACNFLFIDVSVNYFVSLIILDFLHCLCIRYIVNWFILHCFHCLFLCYTPKICSTMIASTITTFRSNYNSTFSIVMFPSTFATSFLSFTYFCHMS